MSPGVFGENLTLDSFHEAKIYLGDEFQIGDCKLEVVQPRIPCYKLGARFGDASVLQKFAQFNRCGIYFV